MKRLLPEFFLVIVWTACSKNPELPPARNDVQLTGTIAFFPATDKSGIETEDWQNATETMKEGDENIRSTRTSMSGSKASFVSGDQIGVSETLTGSTNVKFAYNGSAWSTTTPMYWYNAVSTHTFYAYYPYAASNQGNVVTIPLLTGQSFGTTPDASYDMLAAGPKTQTRTTGTSVALSFRHTFALLQFNIRTSLLTTYSLKSLTLTGGNTGGGSGTSYYGMFNRVNSTAQIGYNLTAQSLQTTANNNTIFTQTLTKTIPSGSVLGLTPVTVYALILPGEYTNPAPTIQVTISPLVGSDKTSTAPALGTTTFLAGTKYVYDVQIGSTVIGLARPPSPDNGMFAKKDIPHLTCTIAE